jgi:hypothetical protein
LDTVIASLIERLPALMIAKAVAHAIETLVLLLVSAPFELLSSKSPEKRVLLKLRYAQNTTELLQ